MDRFHNDALITELILHLMLCFFKPSYAKQDKKVLSELYCCRKAVARLMTAFHNFYG